jgi:tRNA (mo5U34)-methyltransferase
MPTEASPFDIVRVWKRLRTEKGWWHSFELPDGTFIEGANSLASQKARIGQFPIPDDLSGKRVLDIGAWDGWFSFEMERRGAEVVAIDNWDNPRFREMHALLDSRVDYRQMDMYELMPDRLGRFDLVLFMGVLYHLKHPLLGLERVCALTTDLACVDSFVLQEKHRPGEVIPGRPIMEFYETGEMGGQTDTWCGPTVACLLAFCRAAGFARLELRNILDHGACIACRRQWDTPAPDAPAGPAVLGAYHSMDFGLNFNSRLDEYVTAWFEYPAAELLLDEVQPEVGGYGVHPVHIDQPEGGYFQINFKLPPGLVPGWHGVRVRVRGSHPGDAYRIAVDLPDDPAGPLRITGIADGTTWKRNQLDMRNGGALSLWVEGLPENADRNNVRVWLDGRRLPVESVEPAKPEPRQVNARVPADAMAGTAALVVAAGGGRSEAAAVEIVRY